MSSDHLDLGSPHSRHHTMSVYHEGNGDHDALMVRIINDPLDGMLPAAMIDMAIGREQARDLFNFLGIWLAKG